MAIFNWSTEISQITDVLQDTEKCLVFSKLKNEKTVKLSNMDNFADGLYLVLNFSASVHFILWWSKDWVSIVIWVHGSTSLPVQGCFTGLASRSSYKVFMKTSTPEGFM